MVAVVGYWEIHCVLQYLKQIWRKETEPKKKIEAPSGGTVVLTLTLRPIIISDADSKR